MTTTNPTPGRPAASAGGGREEREVSERVKPGQVWADNDPRSKGRTLRVDSIDGAHAVCTVLTNSDAVQRGLSTTHGGRSPWGNGQDTRGKVRRIRLDRFRPTSTGYVLTTHPADLRAGANEGEGA